MKSQSELSAYILSKDIAVSQARISQITKGQQRITADTTLRLSLYFNNSARFWLGLQNDYDIEETINEGSDTFKSIKGRKINPRKQVV